MTNDKELPPLPGHPEPRTMTWSKLEEKAIRDYAGRAVAEALAGRGSATLTNDRIREVFLANGFTIKEGRPDLAPYVYAAAHALIDEALATGFGATQDSPTRAEKVGVAQPSPVVAPPEDAASMRSRLWEAITSCSHTINREEVTLRRDPKLTGNAASQLADRLVSAVTDSRCCGGGPQWGHALDCKSQPDS